jgi:hypothetical protein
MERNSNRFPSILRDETMNDTRIIPTNLLGPHSPKDKENLGNKHNYEFNRGDSRIA